MTSIDPTATPVAHPVAEPDAWYAMPVLTGQLIRLEPMAWEHVAGYLAASRDDEEIFRWMKSPGSASGAPRTTQDARLDVLSALAAR
ncbi:MAG: hypothetical protein ABI345_06620, partial [Jatrophihabitans sp.]